MVAPSSGDSKRSSSAWAKTLAETLLSKELLETIPDAIVAVDHDGTIVQINPQTEELFGYNRDQLIGQKIEILVPTRYRPHHHEHRQHFAEAPKIRRMGQGLDLYGRRRDGTEFPVEISLSPVSTGSGSLVLSAIRDISDRKKIEAELRRANEELDRRTTQQLGEYRARLVAIIDSSEDAIIGKDLDGIITSWNKGAEHIYGYTQEEVIGKSMAMLIPWDRPDEIPGILEKIRRGESVEHYESIRISKDGRRLNVSVTVSPLRDTAGTIVGASAIARDITGQKRTESHLRQAQKMEAIGRLAGGVAHDFNNILGIITACTELLRTRIDSSSEPAQYIANIGKAVERGAALTRQLLTFSRKQVLQPQVLDLNEKLKETSRLLRPLMGDDVEIVIIPRSSSALVEADPGQLDQILVNLGVNARDAMPRGGKFILETGTMELDEAFTAQHRPMLPGKYVMLAVSDTGTGMDEATVSRVFEPFFTTKELGKGTGLGLATVYGIIQQSGGHIWLYSELGRGTTFKIYLPCADHKIGLAREAEIETVAPRRQATTILLVEDDEIMRQMTRKLLEEHGYAVVEAQDGKSALQSVASRAGRIDLLLTDVVMRGMSGPELVVRLNESHPTLKVVFMSGYTGELIANHEVLRHGIPLLEKPFTRTSLLNTIDAALG
jgi:PAS domain S-box-containing protein